MASVRLPEDMERRLEEIAVFSNRSKGYCIKQAIAQYLEDMEDWKIAVERSKKPNQKYYTTEEVLAHLAAHYKKKKH